ncbi:Rpn family recombination-promoting nuclease/putative transposase [Lederbergia sp. NSJ-179]|uniref:Rpn family recombination-promoting nuclease/putative transposase n=1 Tax=Lederbergia sp. NSJ-179 TaxID=2931402 RepID=UPI001FD1627B|nr:Rpn family recombination-promoting nuclease/putative transposase [Lederbergia sp. NSJ-179]MCJ7841554.1 Rpn family recombination-promoting nuclease/putative transposase [Lederbergia sp. NSJ-179]
MTITELHYEKPTHSIPPLKVREDPTDYNQQMRKEKLLKNQLQKNMDYDELRPVNSINILNFPVFTQTERFHTSYHLYEDEEQFRLSNIMEFHFVEMPKLIKDWQVDKLDPWNDVLARWLLMLGMVDGRKGKIYDDIFKELEEIAMKDPILRRAFEDWEESSMTEEEIYAYESRLKYILDKEEDERKKKLFVQQQKAFEQEKKEFEQRKRDLEQEQKGLEQKRKGLEQEKKGLELEKKIWEQEKKEIEQEKRRIKQLKDANHKANEAEQTAKRRIALHLLERGMPIKFVAESTDLDEDKVTEIQREMKE